MRVANLIGHVKTGVLELGNHLLNGVNSILSRCKLSVTSSRKMTRSYLYEICTRSKVANQERDTLTPKCVLQDPCEFTIAIRNSHLSEAVGEHYFVLTISARTAPALIALMTCPKTLRLLLIAALSAIRSTSLPSADLLFSDPARSIKLIFPRRRLCRRAVAVFRLTHCTVGRFEETEIVTIACDREEEWFRWVDLVDRAFEACLNAVGGVNTKERKIGEVHTETLPQNQNWWK